MDVLKRKNAQIAIFFLMALIIFLGFLYGASIEKELIDYQSQKVAGEFFTTQDLANVKNSISVCLKNVLEKGVELIELRGGYLRPEQGLVTLRTEPLTITYLYHTKKDYLPSLGFMEAQLNEYVEQELPYCLDDFKHLVEHGEEIVPGTPRAQVNINLHDVSAKLHYPFAVGGEQKTEDNEFFRAVLPSKLLKVYVEANYIIEGTKEGERRAAEGESEYEVLPQQEGELKVVFHHYPNTLKTIWVIIDDASVKKRHFVFATKSALEGVARQYNVGDGEKTCFAQEGTTCLSQEYCDGFNWVAASDTNSCCQTTCRVLSSATSQVGGIKGGEISLIMFNEEDVAVCWGAPSEFIEEEAVLTCPREHPHYAPATRIGHNEYSFLADDENGVSKIYRVKTSRIGDRLIAEEIYT